MPALVLALLVATTACAPDGQAPRAQPRASDRSGPTGLTLAVYGPAPVVTAYTRIASAYSARRPHVEVDVRAYPEQTAEIAAVRSSSAAQRPDLFLVDREALLEVLGEDRPGERAGEQSGGEPGAGATKHGQDGASALQPLNHPVDELLGRRHLDFGDGYARAGLEAFSDDARLQCMPVDLSPMVVYYNTDLVRPRRATLPGEPPVTPQEGWSIADFGRAARMAAEHGAAGVALDPDVEQVAPFVWAGGGDVVDDPDRPTSTTFADGATTEVLRQLLQLVHDPRLSGGRAAGRPDTGSAVQRFEAGRVGMVVGFRDLVPQLRATPGLHFDVMPLPRLPGEATLGSVRALCLARGAGHLAAAADFLAYAVGDRAARVLARTGFAMPSNLDAVNSPAFLQPGSQPRHARVFVDTVRDVRFLPSGPAWVRTREAIDRALAAIWGSPRAGALQSRLEALDRTSTRLLAPGQSSGSSTG